MGAVDRKVPEHKSTNKKISPRLSKWGCDLILHFYPVGQLSALKKHLYPMYRLSAQVFVYGLYIIIRQYTYIFWKEKYLVFSLPCDLMLPGGESNIGVYGCVHLTISPQLAKFHDHRPCQRGYLMILICYVTTHYHFVKGSCDSM